MHDVVGGVASRYSIGDRERSIVNDDGHRDHYQPCLSRADSSVNRITMAFAPVISQSDVVRQIAQNRHGFAAWMGAGCSAESGVKTGRQICEEIRTDLAKYYRGQDLKAWENQTLNWDDPRRRYSTCLRKRAPTLDQRVEYFRTLLKDKAPAFSHHALSLLMTRRVLKRTCFTTNFDKLIEIAFAQQGFTEFQVIREENDNLFWRGDDYDKNFIIKLHGDYDAFNIKNTLDETIRIPPPLAGIAKNALRSSGLVVLGASGFEDSVIRFFNDLVDSGPIERTLSLGFYWAVNVSQDDDVDDDQAVEALVRQKLEQQSISNQLQELFERAGKSGINCGFFAVAGAGSFFGNLVTATNDQVLISVADRYLDHRVRLRHHLAKKGLDPAAIATRVGRIERHHELHSRTLPQEVGTPTVLRRFRIGTREVSVVLGDISATAVLTHGGPLKARRAVVSPDDDLLSAGAGAALMILMRAGRDTIIRELAKFENVEHTQVAVTSAGNLPVSYILHAAATSIKPDGSSIANTEHVTQTFANVIRLSDALGIDTVITPLIAAGSSGLAAAQSVDALLASLSTAIVGDSGRPEHVVICVRDRHYVRDEEWNDLVKRYGAPL